MAMEQDHARFESLAMPHLNAAYNLARWLTHNDHDAEDVVHESVIRAMRYIGSFRGESARAWLLQIVRNTTLLLAEGEPTGRRCRARRQRRLLAAGRRPVGRRATRPGDAQRRPPPDQRRDRGSSGRLPGSARAARAGGSLVRRDRTHRRRSDRHRDVAARARSSLDARGADAERASGIAPRAARGEWRENK